MSMKKVTIVFVSLACNTSALFNSPHASNATELDIATLQASSTVPVNDNRIAALWSATPNLDTPNGTYTRQDCTTSYLGNNFWLTAHHCVSNWPFMDGFLRQSDGEVAGIAAIYTKSPTDDVALIKTGEGISADPFTLANESLIIGDQAVLTGYGQPHDYASSAVTIISEKVEALNFGNVTYTDLLKGKSSTSSRSCGGDSGAPVYRGNVLYAVHTAGGFNPDCNDGQNRPMWHTNVVSRALWIKETLQRNSSFTNQEITKANTGLEYTAILFPSSAKPEVPNKNSSGRFALSSSQSSSR